MATFFSQRKPFFASLFAILMAGSLKAQPVITSQPQSQTAIAGTNVTFTVGIQGLLPVVTSGNLRLWLKADTGVIVGNSNRVSQWRDQSGRSNDCFQPGTSQQPILVGVGVNGRPVIRFDGIQDASTGDFLQGTNDIGLIAGCTSFIVYSRANRTVDEQCISVIGAPWSSLRAYYIRSLAGINNEMAFSAWANDYGSGFSIPASTYRIWTQRLNGAKTEIEFFDTNETNNFTTASATSFLQIPQAGYYIGGLGSETRNFQGDIAEVIYYQGALTESDRQTVEDYLKQKYFQTGTGSDADYQWLFEGEGIPGATNATLTVTNVQPAHNGHYSVVITNSGGTVTSSNALLTVYLPVSITTQPQSLATNLGSNVTFSVIAEGSDPISYQWQKNGLDLPGITSSSFTLNDVQATNAGIYSVHVSNPVSLAVSSDAILSIVTPPVITTQPQNVTTLVGTNVTFTVGVERPLPAVTSGNLRLWLKADAGVITSSSNRVSEWHDQSDTTNHCYQANANKQPLLINNGAHGRPTIRFDGVQDSSTGDFLQGSGDVGLAAGFTSFMIYSKTDRTISEQAPSFVGSPGNYDVGRGYFISSAGIPNEMAFSAWGNDYGSGFSIPAATYRLWTQRLNAAKTQIEFFDSDGISSFTNARATARLATPASGYYIGGLGSATRNFQGDIAELIYYQGTLSETDRQAVESYLKQNYLQGLGGNNGVSFQWQFNGTDILGATNFSLSLANIQLTNAGNYSVIVSNSLGSVTSSNGALAVLTPVIITSHPQSQSVVSGTNISFSVSATGDSPLSYQWKLKGINLAGATASTVTINNVQSTNAGVYSVVVSNPVSVAVSSNATLSVTPLPVIATQPQSVSVIAGTNVTFSLSVAGSFTAVNSGNMRLWLRADAGVLTGISNRVTQWQDQSGMTNHSFQANTNRQPSLVTGALNGQPVIRFDGIQDSINGDFLQGSNDVGLVAGLTSFIVYSRANRTVAEQCLAVAGVPGPFGSIRSSFIRSASGPANEMAFSAWANDYGSGFSIPASTYRIWTERLNTNKTQVEFFDTDGTSSFKTNRATGGLITPSSGYFVGGLGSNTRNFQGDIAELIYFQGALSETDRQTVEAYLKQKYFQNPGSNESLSFQWQFNGTNILGATNTLLTLTNVQPTEAGNYSVIIANQAGSVISSNASLTVNIPPSITTHPQTQSFNVGSTATFNSVAAGTAPLSYQWQKNGSNISGATDSSLVLDSLQPSDAGNYRMIVSSPFGTATSSNAALTVNVSTIRVLSTNATSASSFTLAIELSALGNENAVGFSLAFDPAILTFTSLTLDGGLSDAFLISNTDQLGSGRLGVAVAFASASTFPAGTQALVQVTFHVGVTTNALNSAINFSDLPTARQVSDVGAEILPAVFVGGTVSIAAVDFEGDCAPRPNGNRTLTIIDWVQVGRFAAGLDSPTNAGEFSRVDCAPRSTLGNGAISVTDWVQAGRYATGLDPLTPAGDPSISEPDKKRDLPLGDISRTVLLEDTNSAPQTHIVSARLVSQGDENAIGFSLAFDPAVLTFVSSATGGNASGAALNMNTNNLGAGRIGAALSLPIGAKFPAGTQEVIKLTFTTAPSATGTTSLTFTDTPILREVSDITANSLPVNFSNASVVLSVPGPLLSILKTTDGIVLSWPTSATNFVLESSTFETNWTSITTNLSTNGQSITTTLPIGDQQQFYRLKK